MLAEIELDRTNAMNLERSQMFSRIFTVKIEHECKDRSWFWPMEKAWSVIYRACCIIFILTQNNSFGAKPHYSNVLLAQTVLFVHIYLCIYVHICMGIHTPAYAQIQCVICVYTYICIYTYKVTAISQVFFFWSFLEQFHILYDNEETSLLWMIFFWTFFNKQNLFILQYLIQCLINQ